MTLHHTSLPTGPNTPLFVRLADPLPGSRASTRAVSPPQPPPPLTNLTKNTEKEEKTDQGPAPPHAGPGGVAALRGRGASASIPYYIHSHCSLCSGARAGAPGRGPCGGFGRDRNTSDESQSSCGFMLNCKPCRFLVQLRAADAATKTPGWSRAPAAAFRPLKLRALVACLEHPPGAALRRKNGGKRCESRDARPPAFRPRSPRPPLRPIPVPRAAAAARRRRRRRA